MKSFHVAAAALVAIFQFSCEGVRSDGSERSPLVDGPAQETRGGKYSYRVVRMKDGLYLKPLFNDTRPFGPFFQSDEIGHRYIHIPANRPNGFSSAQQIYKSKSSGQWIFTDNYIHMRGLPVDFGKPE